MARVVLIEDEPDLREILQYNLTQAGHRVRAAATAEAGLRLAREILPDIILLDLMLPDRPGTTVCTALKREPRTQDIPIIMVTARGEEVDRIVGLELGADDYLVKPFSVRELVLRMNAVLRRGEAREPVIVQVAELRVDRDAHRVDVSESPIPMTPLEFKLLLTLVVRRERVQTRSTLLSDVWELDPGVSSRTVDTHVKRLRDKLGTAGRFIQTVRGVGYRFSERASERTRAPTPRRRTERTSPRVHRWARQASRSPWNLCKVSLVHLAVALTAASLALYSTMMLLFARGMLGRRERPRPDLDRAPRVTIFKPLAGCDDDLEDNLESFARIDYPSFELLLGVASAEDPAYQLARRFLARHRRLEARIVLTDPDAAYNPKVAQLVGLERQATGDVYVVSDSNVRVRPGYLWSLVGQLADDRVGMVTSLFAGTGERTLGAALENLQVCAHTAPGLVALDAVSDTPLTVGKSMAIRRRDLARLGGFMPVGMVLAEDYALGRRFFDAGFVARTSLETVENRNVGCSIGRTLERHTRWCKMRRALSPVAFAVEPIMTPILVASAGFAMAPDKVTAALLGGACVVQTAAAQIAVRALRGHWLSPRYIPLELVRSFVTLLCWAKACVSRRVEWRGHAFTMGRGTTIEPVVASHRGQGRSRLAA